MVTALLMLHSTVDYPLRTLALAVMFAFSCGLMVAPFGERRGEISTGRNALTQPA